jgi:hypothetical protein
MIAERGDKQAIQEQRCEAYFYAATVRMLKGENAKAKEYSDRCRLGLNAIAFRLLFDFRFARSCSVACSVATRITSDVVPPCTWSVGLVEGYSRRRIAESKRHSTNFAIKATQSAHEKTLVIYIAT